MDILNHQANLHNENSGLIENSKSSTLKSGNKFGTSLITNTPARRKLGNLSNTPIRSVGPNGHLKQMNGKSLSGKTTGEKKCIQQTPNLVQYPIGLDDIENAYPMSQSEFRQCHLPSEMSDYFVQTFHPIIMQAPLDDDEDNNGRLYKEMCDDEYFYGLL